MNHYLIYLVSRLKNFSAKLDNIESFVEIPWVVIDEKMNQQKYIFQRNGELVMSLNGTVTLGRWEFLQSAKSLLIHRVEDKILLNQAFIDSAVMALKRDGVNTEYLFLANENLIPDLDILNYLKKLYHKKNNFQTIELENGKVLTYSPTHFESSYLQAPVMIDEEPVEDGTYNLKNDSLKILIKGGKIIKVITESSYDTDLGKIKIRHTNGRVPIEGDMVFKGDSSAPDGKYKIDFLWSIIVSDGRILKNKKFF